AKASATDSTCATTSGVARASSSGASARRGALTVDGSRSRPARTDIASAASATERVRTPTWSSDHASGITPATGTRPSVPLNPTTPQYAAGRSTEPTVLEPRPHAP